MRRNYTIYRPYLDLSPDERRALRLFATQQGKTIQEFITDLVRLMLARMAADNPAVRKDDYLSTTIR
jgi:hypothetical protein